MTTIIYYPCGAYGTFVEWLLNYLTDPLFPDESPFDHDGSSHKFIGNFIEKGKPGIDRLKKDKPKFARTHPILNSLDDLKDYQIINISYDKDKSLLWAIDNHITKRSINEIPEHLRDFYRENYHRHWLETTSSEEDRVRYLLDHEDPDRVSLTTYGVSSAHDLKRWQLREIFSYWLDSGPTGFLKGYYPIDNADLYTITMEGLRDNLPVVIDKLTKDLNITIIPQRTEKLEYIWSEWLSRQTQINKDGDVKKYIQGIVGGQDFAIADLTFIDECLIQNDLRRQGYEIKCDGLDYFPLSTKEMQELIYDNSTNTERT